MVGSSHKLCETSRWSLLHIVHTPMRGSYRVSTFDELLSRVHDVQDMRAAIKPEEMLAMTIR
jgi:hypothetical protein